jgi:uncharacterized RDD family membrane protein YckC
MAPAPAADRGRIDTVREVETPEGVVLTLRLAGPMVRGAAWGLDFVLRGMVLTVVILALACAGHVGEGLAFLAFFALEWLYPVVFEVLASGATPGKRLLGLQVVSRDGRPVDWTSSVLRNLLRAADILPFGYAIGLVAMLMDEDFRRLGDVAAGTVVIHRERVAKEGHLPRVPPVRVPVALRLEEQRALVDFGLRFDDWGSDRANELVGLLAPLVGDGDDRLEQALGMARQLQGEAEEGP